jgi:hypothetical protein
MEEAPENGKESSHSAQPRGMNEWMNEYMCVCVSIIAVLHSYTWFTWFYHIIPHYLQNGTIFENNVTEHKTHFSIFSVTLFLKQFSF